jgi:hypothetical protein
VPMYDQPDCSSATVAMYDPPLCSPATRAETNLNAGEEYSYREAA